MTTTYHLLPGVAEKLTWFKDSPNTGDPACLCSWCGEAIKEGEMPIRASRESDHTELRLHIGCAQRTIVQFAVPALGADTEFKDRPEYAEGRAAYLDGARRGSNPYSGKAGKGPAWYAGWDEAWRESHAKRD